MFLNLKKRIRSFFNSILSNKQLGTYFFFFCISFSFWFLSILSKIHETTINIPLEYTRFPISFVQLEQPENTIKVRVKAAGISIISFYMFNRKKLILNYDVANYKPMDNGQNLFWIMNSMRKEIGLVLGNNIEILNVSPEKISSSFVNKATKKVPVILNSETNLRQEYWIKNEPVLKPDSVLLFGRKEVLDSVKYVTTDLLTLNDIYKDETYDVEIILSNSIKSDNQFVSVEIDVDPFIEHVFTQNVQIRNLEEGYTMKIFPRKVSATLRITKDKYQFLKFNTLNLYVDASKCIEEKTIFVNHEKLPDFVKIIRIYPNELEYILIKE